MRRSRFRVVRAGRSTRGTTGRRFPSLLYLGLTVVVLIVPYGLARAGDGIWEETAKLLPSDGAPHDKFGYSVAICGDTAIVGCAEDDDNGVESGSAYVYVRSGGAWTLQEKITASDGQAYDFFGSAVAVDGDTVVVGTPRHETSAGTIGAAYVFVRNGTSWTQQAELSASEGALPFWFISVAISGNTVVIGNRGPGGLSNPGAAYVFVRSGTTWTQQAKLMASDAGLANSFFGRDVAISGDTVIVGAYGDNPPDAIYGYYGSAYVFARSGTSWSQQAKLVASDASPGDYFGYSVAISGDTAVAGAYGDDEPLHSSGSVYVFQRSGTSWAQQARLVASDAAKDNVFGINVDIWGDTIVARNWRGEGSAVYVFARDGASWSEEVKLPASDGAAWDTNCTGALAISGDRMIAGACSSPSVAGDVPGSAYIFERRGLVPPVADAGPNQAIHVGDTVELDGSNSYDDTTDTTDLVYEWSFVSRPAGSTATLDDTTPAYPSFTADKTGTYEVRLVVTDEDDLVSEPDNVVISSDNIAPTADAGPDAVVLVDELYSLAGSGYDPDDDAMTYMWTLVTKPSDSTATLTDATTQTPDLTPDEVGDYVIKLVVSDGYADSDPDYVIVTAVSSNDYAIRMLMAASSAILALEDDDFAAKGHRQSMCASIRKIIRFIEDGNITSAVEHLERLMERADGFTRDDEADPMGAGQNFAGDWIVDEDGQLAVYYYLNEAWETLT